MAKAKTIMSGNEHVIISTDIEPDDFLGLRYVLSNYRSYPNNTYQILVGEGLEKDLKARADLVKTILEAAVLDGYLTTKQMESNFEILLGSPTRKEAYVDAGKLYHNSNYVNLYTREGTEYLAGEQALNSIEYAIRIAKNNGKKVVIHAWKPLHDLPKVVNKLQNETILNENDTIIVSGSYNVRELKQKDDTSKLKAIDKMLNGPMTSVLFEAYATYEKPAVGSETPKHILYSDKATEFQGPNNELSSALLKDNTNLGELANQGRSIWNRGVSMDCIEGCLNRIIEAAEDIGQGECSTVTMLKQYKTNLSEIIGNTKKSIDQINIDFVSFLNSALSSPGFFSKEELSSLREKYPSKASDNNIFEFFSGSETKTDDVITEFKDRLGKKEMESRIDSFMDWNFKILEAIIRDPNEMLIGDATCAIYAQDSNLFHTVRKNINYAECNAHLKTTGSGDDLEEGNCNRIVGVKNYSGVMEQFLGLLHEDLAGSLAPETNRDLAGNYESGDVV